MSDNDNDRVMVHTCWQGPAPLDDHLPQEVGMPHQTPPPAHNQLLVAGGGHSLQVGQGGVGGVPGKLTSLGLRRPEIGKY